MDIRKRICKFPKPGKKAQMICIPTTAGTGSEVTPFAIITDDKTHVKYSLADYAFTPNMAIIDAQFMMGLPPRMTAVTAADAFSHCFESYVSLLSTPRKSSCSSNDRFPSDHGIRSKTRLTGFPA